MNQTKTEVTRFGDEVQRRRKASGLNQRELALSVGMEPLTLANLEAGRTAAPTLQNTLRLCLALRITPNEMASMYGMWKGKPLDNDKLNKQLAFTLSNLERLASSLSSWEQEELMIFLDKTIETYQLDRRKIRKIVDK